MSSLFARAGTRASGMLQRLGEQRLRPAPHLPPLERLPANIRRAPCPRVVDRIPGWLSRDECRALYALGFHVRGPFLEVGPWVGKSTVCIALGIRDSGETKPFVTCELNPTLDNFRPYRDAIGFFVPADSAEPLAELSPESFTHGFKPVLERPGRAIEALEANLAVAGVRHLVTVVEGDSRHAPPDRYGFVFADTMHSPAEIASNLPPLTAWMDAGTVLACHDTNDENEACIRAIVRVRSSRRVGSLFIAEIGR